MHWFDLVAGLMLLLGAVWSFFRGLTREVLSILGITAAIVLAAQGYPYLIAGRLETVVSQPWLRQLLGFAAIFLTTALLYILFAWLLRRLVKAAGLSLLDRFLGGLFGLLKVGIILSAFVIFAAKFSPPFAATLARESKLAPPLFRTANVLTMLLPAQIYDDFHRLYTRAWLRFGTSLPLQPPPRSSQPSTPHRASPKAQPPPEEGISASDAQALERLLRERLQQP